jgi:ABC-2 type transport system permease protein
MTTATTATLTTAAGEPAREPARASSRPGRRSLARIYALEAKYEFLKVLRLPGFAISTLAFPVMFYLLFGVTFGRSFPAGPVTMATYLLGTYGAFGVIGAALTGFGVGVAVERGQGWTLLKRASPMPPGAYFAAKLFVAAVFGAAVVASLFLLGAFAGGVELPAATWAALAGVLIAGTVPFCAFGLALGCLAGPNSAPALVNLIYLPMGFLSGLWLPVNFLPGLMKQIALGLPAYHYGQLALKTIGADLGQPAWVHLAYLAVFTALSLAVARWAYRRDEGKTYG